MPSSGKKRIETGLSGFLAPVAARALLKGIPATMRIRREGIDRLDSMQASGLAAVLAFFHGRQFLLMSCLRGRKIATMASLSRDGELQARTMTGLGYGIVRGSASRGGARGVIGLMKLMKNGYWPAFAVDGPRGPIHEVKPGAVFLAKREGVPLIPLASSARPAVIFRKAWDRYLLPMPLGRGAVLLGDPVTFDDDMGEEAIARDCETLRVILVRLQEKADRMTGLKFEV
jgi:lysophospholipid acyltransferase (LPLAT)-like uncharacterized protein